MASSSSTKKRKRDDVDDNTSHKAQVTLSLLEDDPGAIGPVLASFPAIEPSKSTSFQSYHLEEKEDYEGKEFSSQSLHVAGETDTVEFHSTAESEEAGKDCRYLVGVRNKKTNVVTFRPAPIQIFSRSVKALKNIAPAEISNAERIAARNALGETFGTKKAQKAIRAAERNKVDVSAMQGVTSHIQGSIEANTQTLPTQEKAKEIEDDSRNIPKFNADAQRPSDVYKLYDIIPEAEFNEIDISGVLSVKTDFERMGFTSFKHSDWVRQQLHSICSMSKPDKKAVKMVLYVAAMLSFRSAAQKLCNNREAMEHRLPGMPTRVVDGLLGRFTESTRGGMELRYTTENQIKLLTHMFALCLRVDNYATDTTLLAKDLNEPVTTVNQHFKMLGCKIEKLTVAELARLQLPASTAETKRAVLKVPLEFPKAKMKRRN